MQPILIEPAAYTAFSDEAELIEQCKEWNLLSEKASKSKTFFYKRNGRILACRLIGYVDKMTAVIELEDKQLHCIHPSYLKEMQASTYGQKSAVGAEDAAEPASAVPAVTATETPAKETPELEAPEAKKPPAEEPGTAELPTKGKTKKEKSPKLQLPGEKVKMTATVKQFTTVPNNFSDNDDEVIIYEAVSIAEPATEIGEAWSSNSATMKKLELDIGDMITFEAKIIAKKLTRHPVPYKLNNPSKVQKQES
ncbi:hypothetical protein NLX71_02385 [Paenibacillus sp. MZ04-78.2]|uniref:hypothetical protein n=1 Tax=Paenibacillus sp. MZ04-78.2 TaxID=2962034 RepID=UPI0020B88642|nr:hypothetical protein [Paenibacillus sp. MZ04-78.2]MCP3772167.1 hypothetical protein [Paenibacillus sp. MZ04-78.2]